MDEHSENFNEELENIKNQTQLENKITKTKNTLEDINSRLSDRGTDQQTERQSSGNHPSLTENKGKKEV